MPRTLRILSALALLLGATSAAAISQSIKRENPLLVQTAAFKGAPASLGTNTVRGVAFDGTQVWVALVDTSDVVKRFDIASNKKVGSDIVLPAGSYPNALVFDGTYVWVFCMNLNKAYKYSTAGALQSGFPITLSGGVRGAAFDGDFIWASTVTGTGAVDRINVTTRAVTTTASNVGTAGAVAFDGKNLWIGESAAGTAKIDGTTGARLFFNPALLGPSSVTGIGFDGRFVWMTSQGEDVIRKIDPASNAVVATVATYPDPRNVAFDGTYLWVTSQGSDAVQKIDVRTNQIVDAIQLAAGSRPYGIAFDGSHMWVDGDSGGSLGDSKLHKFLATGR